MTTYFTNGDLRAFKNNPYKVASFRKGSWININKYESRDAVNEAELSLDAGSEENMTLLREIKKAKAREKASPGISFILSLVNNDPLAADLWCPNEATMGKNDE